MAVDLPLLPGIYTFAAQNPDF